MLTQVDGNVSHKVLHSFFQFFASYPFTVLSLTGRLNYSGLLERCETDTFVLCSNGVDQYFKLCTNYTIFLKYGEMFRSLFV
jgi:hypothetical protein